MSYNASNLPDPIVWEKNREHDEVDARTIT